MDAPCRTPRSLIDEFERCARSQPWNVAIEQDERVITYEALSRRVDDIAAYLLDRSIQPGAYVGVCLRPGVDLIATLLAILKVGAAYVPVDRAAPAERLRFITADAQLSVLISDPEELPRPDSLWRAERHYPSVGPDAEAYVIYTSGSTGQPKGVICTHHNVLRLLTSTEHEFSFSAQDRWTWFHSVAFDFSVWEIFGCLLYGGTLVVVDPELARDSVRFAKLLIERHITVLNQTPTALYNLIRVAETRNIECFTGIRVVVLGGERLQLDKLRHWFEPVTRPRLINMYGITETTVHVTFREITAADARDNPHLSPIGGPIRDLTVHLLNDDLTPVTDGESGEICVAGPGVARGYLNRPELTAQRFVRDPFDDGSQRMMYRSGDLGRRLSSGELVYLGRMDRQVKIRGYRIELGEVEGALLRTPGIVGAHVATASASDGDTRLLAYVIPDAASWPSALQVDVRALRESLARTLPGHMIPSQFCVVSELPLTLNGKIDEQALAKLASDSHHSTDTRALDPIEQRVKAIWLDALQLPDVDVDTGLYDLGAHSLALVVIAMQLLETFDVEVPVSELRGDASIASIADRIRARLTPRGDSPMIEESPHEAYLTRLWQVHLNRPSIDPGDNFFSSGGSSMQAIEMLMTVSDELGAEIDYSEFFREPSIRKLAQLLEG